MNSVIILMFIVLPVFSFIPLNNPKISHNILYNNINNDQVSYKYSKDYYYYLLKHKKINNDISNIIFEDILLGSGDLYQHHANNRRNNYFIYERNLININDFNKKNKNCQLELNKFSDTIDFSTNSPDLMTPVKINRIFILKYYKRLLKQFKKQFKFYWNNALLSIKNIPSVKIWNNTILSEVKSQGECGSCWAFSTTSSIESLMRINNYSTIRLSEQQLVDCSIENYGCSGGIMDKAYDYIIENNGLLSNKDYEYNNVDQQCLLIDNINNVKNSNITTYFFTIPYSKRDLMNSVNKNPVAIALDANNIAFRFYKSGIIDVPSTETESLNHAVLLVGYSYDENGGYWIIQNSWGKDWGDNGFAKIRHKNGKGVLLCQIYGVYPSY